MSGKTPDTDQTPVDRGDATELLLRIAAILVLAPATIAIVWYGGRAFSALVAFICIMMIFEWTRLVERKEFSPGFYILSFTAVLAMFMAAGGGYGEAYSVALFGAILGIGGEWISNGSKRWAVLGVAYVIVPCIALIWLRQLPEQGRELTFFLYISVWATDIFAYVAGKLIGGPLLAPRISPGKTWAGALGGLAAAIAAGFGYSFFSDALGSAAIYALVAFGLGIAAITGDIAESAIKRHFGVKDSGGYIPGHGGLMDRLDGMVLSTVLFSAGLLIWHVG